MSVDINHCYNPLLAKSSRAVFFSKIFFIVCLFSASQLIFFKSAEAGTSVVKMFQKATSQVQNSKMKSAEKTLKKIVRMYPEYEPGLLLMAKVQYRLGRNKRAYKFFKKVHFGLLDSISAFEYGTVAYSRKDWKRAIRAFRLVSKSDPLKRFAYYYSGVSYLKLRQYRKALKSLKRARRLPSSLSSSRRRLLNIARERINREDAGGTFRQAPQILVPVPTAATMGWAPLPPEPGDKKKKRRKIKPKGPFVGPSISVTPSVSWLNKTLSQDFSGTRESESKSSILSAGASGLFRFDLPSLNNAGQPNIGLAADVQELQVDNSGTDTKFSFSDETGGVLTSEKSTTENKSSQSMKFYVQPKVALPVTKDIDLSAFFKYGETWPDNDSSQMTGGFQTFSGSLSLGLGPITLSSAVSYTEFFTLKGGVSSNFNSTSSLGAGLGFVDLAVDLSITFRDTLTKEPLTKSANDTIFSSTVSKSLGILSLKGLVRNTELTPPPGEQMISGRALSSLEFSGTASVSLSFGLSIIGVASTTSFSNYGQKDLVTVAAPTEDDEDTTVDVITEGTIQSFSGTGKISPTDWLYFSLAYKSVTTNYKFFDVDASPYFFQAVPDYVTTLTLSAGLSKTF